MTANGDSIVDLPPLFQFSLLGTLNDMWTAKVYPLCFIILVFSGVWPYAKLLIMLFCWLAPSRHLKIHVRQRLLNFLDAYGKWSIVDSIFMIMFSVAFNIIVSPELAPVEIQQMLHEADASPLAAAYVLPGWGFQTFLVASIASLVLGMVMTASHRYALQIGEFDVRSETEGRSRLCNALPAPSGALCNGFFYRYAPIVAVSASLCLVCVGLFCPSFQFQIEGMLALILGPERSLRTYSVVSLGLAIPDGNPSPNSFGIRWIQLAYFVFVVLAVVMYHALLLVLWCAPLSKTWQRKILIATQALDAVSSLDVFVVSIVASVAQIQQFASFIVGSRCDAIDAIVARTPLAARIPGSPKCFDLETHLLPGFWILALAAVISSITGRVMISRCSSALIDATADATNGDTTAESGDVATIA